VVQTCRSTDVVAMMVVHASSRCGVDAGVVTVVKLGCDSGGASMNGRHASMPI